MDEILIRGTTTGKVLGFELVLSPVNDRELAVSNEERQIVAPDSDLFVPTHAVADDRDVAHCAALEHHGERRVDVDFSTLVVCEGGNGINALAGRPKDDVKNVTTGVIQLTTPRKSVDLSPSSLDCPKPFLALQNADVLNRTRFAGIDLRLDVPKLGLEVTLVTYHANLADAIALRNDFMGVGNSGDQRLL